MDFIDFYTRAIPALRAKQAPTLWDGPVGQLARARGVRTSDELAVYSVIEAASKDSGTGAQLTDGEIARRLRASPDATSRIVQALVVRGVVRANLGTLGTRSLTPIAAA